ncbi:MAG: peptide chain release factor N(5)-glutamine methyltransferase [Halothece sp.]
MVSGLELSRWREQSRKQAVAQSISPQEVDWLLQAWAGLTPLSLRLETYKMRSEIPLRGGWEGLRELWEKRLQQRVPIQYLVGEMSWRDLQLKVSPAVLIPRPETEMIVEIALDRAGHLFQTGHWVDLGTGSGAIALALAQALPQATIHAVDCSSEALKIAQENTHQLGLTDNIEFHLGSWFSPLTHLQGDIRVMVSNPPYIPTATLSQLQPEVAQHEPKMALDGGNDGLDAIRHLMTTAPKFLQNEGLWVIEMGADQGELVKELLTQTGNYYNIEIIKDLAGIPRFAVACMRK